MTEPIDADRERWLAGELDTESERRWEERVLSDPDRAENAFSDLELHGALVEAATARGRRFEVPWRSRRLRAAVVLIAASLVLFAMPMLYRQGDEGPTLRGELVPTIIGLSPGGELREFPRRFVWRAANAGEESRYRWELYDADARRRGFAIVDDTLLVRSPEDTPSDSVGTWLWLVIEVRADGSEGVTSEGVEFRVLGDAER